MCSTYSIVDSSNTVLASINGKNYLIQDFQTAVTSSTNSYYVRVEDAGSSFSHEGGQYGFNVLTIMKTSVML